jgi:hypothetical protein
MTPHHLIATELGRDLCAEERLVCGVEALWDEEADSLELSEAEVVWRLQRRISGATTQELARLVPAVRLAYAIAWRLAVEQLLGEAANLDDLDDLDDEDDEPEGLPCCPTCGGSGGGPEHLRCTACGGSGM